MSLLESQLDARARYDSEMSMRAYSELAASVTGTKRFATPWMSETEKADGAVIQCLQYNGVQAGTVPDGIEDFDERMTYMCRPSGTMFRAVRLDGNWYRQSFGAMLGRLDTGEAVALLPKGMSGYYYLDPATNDKVALNEKTNAHLQRDAILFYRALPARALKVTDLLTFIFQVYGRSDYLAVLVASAAVTLIGLLPAWANNIAFKLVVPSGETSLILPIGVLLLGVALSSTLIGATRNLVMRRIGTKLRICVEAATFSRMLSLPPAFFRDFASGDLSSRIARLNKLTQSIVSLTMGTALSLVLSLVYLLQIFAYAPHLALPAFAVVAAQAIITIFVTRATMRFEQVAIEASSKQSGVETALLNGIQKIKLAGAEERAFSKWAHGYSEYASATYNRPKLLLVLPALIPAVGMLGNLIIFLIAGSTGLSIPDYMSFSVAYGQLTGAIMTLASTMGEIAKIRPTLEMVGPLLEAEPEVSEDKTSVGNLSGSIEMSNVSFRYSEEAPYVLKNISFRIYPGEYVAIVGKSGCGKSTIMRLLLGFEKPARGSILYGPYDMSKVDPRSVRRSIGVVTQDGKLFMGSLLSNITVANPTATLDDAWAAAEIAGIADDIRAMPMGMQTMVTEGGGGISGGQRQRIMIARAICGHKRILMLDEATSALDNITQKSVADSLASLNCTRVVIAHRLSTIRNCDRIMVVDGGRIAEEGTYDELVAQKGLFADLVERQRLEE